MKPVLFLSWAGWYGRLLSAWLLVPLLVSADRQAIVRSTVTWNERSSRVEVVHRLHLHDARVALDRMTQGRSPGLASLEGRARLALSVEADFALLEAGQPLALDLVGATLEGDTLFVYQESEVMNFPADLTGSSTILQGLLPGVEQRLVLRLEVGR